MAPTGGPKDATAPLLKKRSMLDSALNFKGGNIRFDFDELIQLRDVQNQLIVTPLLKKNPTATVHKKRVTIAIQDSLLEPNTTYAISMGSAIQDVRESNAYKDLSFTFSTGSYFDSLSMRGSVVEANTGRPDTSGMVVLYKADLPDSAFFNQKPLYAQKIQAGRFFFKNLPDKDFSIYVLNDQNSNLRYDQPNEKIAFYNQKRNPKDTTPITLYSFVAQETLDSNSIRRAASRSAMSHRTSMADSKEITRLQFIINADTLNKTKRTFDLNDSVRLQFNHPLKSLNANNMTLFQNEMPDSNFTVSIDSTRKVVTLNATWLEEASCKIVLKKGFAIDSTGLQANAVDVVFKTKRTSDYGKLIVQCKKEGNELLELIKNDQVIARKKVTDSLVVFSFLSPDTYVLRLLHDENNNGAWDTGAFFEEKKQPEHVDVFPAAITIRANWENKIDVDANRTKKPGLKK